MSKRQVEWAKRAKMQLRLHLGYACFHCGRHQHLEFDCIEPMGDKHHKAGFTARICFYRRQATLGNLQLLCPRCHSIKTEREQRGPRGGVRTPPRR